MQFLVTKLKYEVNHMTFSSFNIDLDRSVRIVFCIFIVLEVLYIRALVSCQRYICSLFWLVFSRTYHSTLKCVHVTVRYTWVFFRIRANRPYSHCQILKPSLVFLNRASYGRRWNNDVTSHERYSNNDVTSGFSY